jgi:DMSO reductase family type II enzyme heme b subunit
MVQHLSPFMALSENHGRIDRLRFRLAHNGKTVNVWLSWADPSRDDRIADLDQFVDGVAVMFPMTGNAPAVTMGNAGNPVNAWLWRADRKFPYDVLAHGFGTSRRRSGKELGLQAASHYEDGNWSVVFQRQLRSHVPSSPQVSFKPRDVSGIAFAVWDGGNAERSAQKSFSGDWLPFRNDG